MHRRVSPSALVMAVAVAAAAFLTLFQRSPEGLIGLGVGEREVRAAPGAPSSSVKNRHDLSELKVFNQTLIRITDSYVDPSRIDPQEMLYGALDSVQFNIPEVLVETDREHHQVTVVVGDDKQVFDASSVDSPWRLSALLKKIMRFVEANMNPGADLAQVEYAAVNGMLSTLDPHSVLLDPETAREMDVSTQGHFGGLGIVIQMVDKKLTVIRPMPNTPAALAGVQKGDRIIKINGEITENLTLQEAVLRMRGKPGSAITLWIERDGVKGLTPYKVVRDEIYVPSVKSKLLDAGTKHVGYLKIDQFAGNTAKELKTAMDALRDQGVTGWILDLRHNPGGLLEQAIMVADLFVDHGTIVTTVSGKERDPRQASRKDSDTHSPVVVLVNSGSASASEIVAGALKNLNRALILGTKTFGKGSVQILYDNPDDSKLKLTIAQYLTPGNLSIQGLGIVPDIALQRMFVPTKNASYKDYLRLLPPSKSYGEKDLKSSLSSRYARGAIKPSATLSFVYDVPSSGDDDDRDSFPGEEDEDDDIAEIDSDEIKVDFEIGLARDIVAQAGRSSRQQMVRAAQSLIRSRAQLEDRKVTERLAKLGVDWSAPARGHKRVSTIRATLEITGKTHIAAGSKLDLRGTVTNTGTETAYRVLGRIESHDRVFEDRELVFGKLEPGQTRTWVAHVKVPQSARDRIDYLTFDVQESRHQVTQAKPLKLRIASAPRPVFAYSHQLVDSGNGDGLVQRGETYRLKVTIKNTGPGVAKDVTAILRNASGDMVHMTRARFQPGDLAPGQSKEVEFAFDTTRQAKGEVVVELSVFDGVFGESVVEKLHYPVRGSAAGPVAATGSVEALAPAQLFEGASETSAPIAIAPKGAVLKLTGTAGSWLRVDLGGRPGFVQKHAVRPVNLPVHASAMRRQWQVTPPELQLEIPSYETASATYRLCGTAKDDSRVADVFIYVSNSDAKIENRKVFYRSNGKSKDQTSMNMCANIPLWPGSNAVTVVARENSEVQAVESLYLYRTGGDNHEVARDD